MIFVLLHNLNQKMKNKKQEKTKSAESREMNAMIYQQLKS